MIGSDDLLIAPSDCENFYAVLNPPKEFVEIKGAAHMDFTGLPLNPDKVPIIEKYTKNWFDYYLKGDMSKYTYLFGQDAQADLTKKVLTKLNFTE
jgi:hypothetical protein